MEKNAALEQLAAGVVRHFQSLLDVFQGHGERISVNPDVPMPARRQAAEIMAAAERGVALAGELMQFSRQAGWATAGARPGDRDRGFASGAAGVYRTALRGSLHAGGGLGHVLIERTRFSSLLSHLVTNACEAMPDGGPIEINLSNAKRIGDSNRSSLFVLLEVTDHSKGLDEAALLHVMEPYSTPEPRIRPRAGDRASDRRGGGRIHLHRARRTGDDVQGVLPAHRRRREAVRSRGRRGRTAVNPTRSRRRARALCHRASG